MDNNRFFPAPGAPDFTAHHYRAPAPYDPSGHKSLSHASPYPEPYATGYAPQGDHAFSPQLFQNPYAAYPGQTAYPGQAAAPAYYDQSVNRGAGPFDGQGTAAPLSLAGVTHALGAVLSVALILGAGNWAWNLMQRDVAGVPVVRALEGPVRVMPEDPGGRQAAHQGLSVNELAAAREDTPREQIVLAPPPLELPADDILPPARVQPERSEPDNAQPIPVALTQEISVPQGSALGMNNPTRRAVAQSPRPPRRDESALSQSRMATASDARGSGAFQGDDLAATVASSVAAGLSSVRDLDVDPATIGPGTRLVQLGAYDDIATARAAWDQLARRFAPLLDDRGRVIEAAHSGGSVFYRLRAHGFTDERDARRFCAALVDQQIDCIPVLIR